MKVYGIYLMSPEWTHLDNVLQEVYISKELAQSRIFLYSKDIQDELYIEEIEVLETLDPEL